MRSHPFNSISGNITNGELDIYSNRSTMAVSSDAGVISTKEVSGVGELRSVAVDSDTTSSSCLASDNIATCPLYHGYCIT